MKENLQEMFNIFNAVWIRRFDEFQEAMSPQMANFAAGTDDSCSTTKLPFKDVMSNDEFQEVRDAAFPQLLDYYRREQHLRARSRYLTTQDYEQSIGLLRHDEMKTWFATDKSKLLWVNSWINGSADWASAFCLNLLDHATQLPYITALFYFCQNRQTSVTESVVADILQLFISQTIDRHLANLNRKAVQLIVEQCKSAGNDPGKLWSILNDVNLQAEAKCIWIMVDAIDGLGLGDGETLLGLLGLLVNQTSITVKVFITSRNAGPSKMLSPSAVNGGAPNSSSAVITMTRARHRNLSTLLAKHTRRPGRLPDDSHDGGRQDGAISALGDLDDLEESESLGSFEREDLFASSEDDEDNKLPAPSKLRRNKESFLGDSDLDLCQDGKQEAQLTPKFGLSEESEGDDVQGATAGPLHKSGDRIAVKSHIDTSSHGVSWDSDSS